MPQFPIESKWIRGETAFIKSRDLLKHFRALRLKMGDEVTLIDQKGERYRGILESISKDSVRVHIAERLGKSAKDYRLTLAQAIPKSAKMDQIIEKATELGVDRVVPFFSSRTEVTGPIEGRLERWKRVAQAATKQSVRADLIKIEKPLSFEKAIVGLEGDRLMLWEGAAIGSFKGELEKSGRTISLVVGPEGGFAPEEVELFEQAGGRAVSFGKNILRTETAGMAAVAVVLYHWGEL